MHASEHVGEIVEWIDPARLARGDQRVQAGEALAGGDVALPSAILRSERSEALLSSGTRAIVEEDAELLRLPERVADGDAERALRRVARALIVEPGSVRPEVSQLQVCACGKSLLLRVVLDAVQVGDQVERFLRNPARF